MVNNTIQYGSIIHSKENLTTVEDTLNDHFQEATETDYFTEHAIHGQIANLTQIISIGPKFTKGEIAVISLFSIFAFVIFVTGLGMCLADECTKGSVVVFITTLLLITISGPLVYFAVAGTVDWSVSGSVVATVTVISTCIIISVLTGLFDRFVNKTDTKIKINYILDYVTVPIQLLQRKRANSNFQYPIRLHRILDSLLTLQSTIVKAMNGFPLCFRSNRSSFEHF